MYTDSKRRIVAGAVNGGRAAGRKKASDRRMAARNVAIRILGSLNEVDDQQRQIDLAKWLTDALVETPLSGPAFDRLRDSLAVDPAAWRTDSDAQ